jgi:5-methylcytosine-specific restriction protein A
MATRSKRYCSYPGCNELVTHGRCEKHIKHSRKQYDNNRPEWHDMYNDPRYKQERLLFLRRHPLCVDCEKEGKIEPATRLDHIEDHKGNYQLFWNKDNWQGLCEHHHNSKTAKTNNRKA